MSVNKKSVRGNINRQNVNKRQFFLHADEKVFTHKTRTDWWDSYELVFAEGVVYGAHGEDYITRNKA